MKLKVLVVIIVLAAVLPGCARSSGHEDSTSIVRYESRSEPQTTRETLLRYPEDWPETSARRERRE